MYETKKPRHAVQYAQMPELTGAKIPEMLQPMQKKENKKGKTKEMPLPEYIGKGKNTTHGDYEQPKAEMPEGLYDIIQQDPSAEKDLTDPNRGRYSLPDQSAQKNYAVPEGQPAQINYVKESFQADYKGMKINYTREAVQVNYAQPKKAGKTAYSKAA